MGDAPQPAWQPLTGITIIDFSMLLPGPFATLMLADLGADVIKIEPPRGDYARDMPGHLFRGAARNKRSIVIDLKAPAAVDLIARLAQTADIAIEGFRPGVAGRLGIDAKALQTENPRLICCSISGYGQSGPKRNHPGHDLAYLAQAGAFQHSGHWREPPRRSSAPVADLLGGANAAIAILAALHERDHTDRGTFIDISLYEAALYVNGMRFGFDTDGASRDHLYPTNDLFTTGDGQLLAITIVEEKFWQNFCAAAGHLCPELLESRFADENGRRQHGDGLMDTLETLFASAPLDHWLRLCQEHDVPATACLTVREAMQSPHSVARGIHRETAYGTVLPFPALVRGAPPHSGLRPPPRLGEHSRDVLAQIGLTPERIEALVASGVVVAPARSSD
ncbi:MAG: CaiB/BaiF CoA-transferase family protein [Pseudomonadota bacterium]